MRFLLPLAFLVSVGIVSANDSDQAAVFQDSWADSPNRPWPGPDWHANRAQDWQIQGSWLRCLTGEDRTAGRTVHLLTQRIENGSEAVDLGVTVKPTTPGNFQPTMPENMRDGACFGLLVGMGNEQIDYRATALVQQAPAAGGGMLISVDSDGKLSLRDFSKPLKEGGYWTIPGNVDFRNLTEIAAADFPIGAYPVRLGIHWEADQLTVRAVTKDKVGNRIEASFAVKDIGREKLRGGISLFSARGTEKSKTGFSFASFQLIGGKSFPERSWGPILGVLYTQVTDQYGDHALRMTAQHPALAEGEAPKLEIAVGNQKPILGSFQSDGSFTTRFEAPFPQLKESLPFALLLEGEKVYEGVLRREPFGQQEPLVGVLSCVKNQVGPLSWNPSGLWFPHNEIADSVATQDPDLLYFAGDQIYEGDITGVDRRTPWHSIMDYHTKWRRFLWSFGELTRTRPTICVPDDHDVFHGNLWGAGGKIAKKQPGMSAQDAGGYKMPATFVNAVHSTLVAHLPPTQVSPTIGQGISTYTTSFSWGGLDFCVLADRMWKDSPASIVPDLNFKNGWPQADEFEPKDSDVAGAQLLGTEQEAFLAEWAERKTPNTWTKVVLSQSPFACMHTLPGRQKSDNIVPGLKVPLAGDYPENDQPVIDADSNGWPQTPRDRAVKSLAKAGALHLTGDQHLGSVAWYGVDEFRDGSVVFSSPAMGNTFPRRWMPKEAGINPEVGAPRYTGDYLDGFGNKVTILAIANPADEGRKPELLYNRAPGYGLVRFHPQRKMATLEAWPRWSNPNDPSQMFPGWPVMVRANGTPAKNTLQLPAVITDGMVLQRESKVKIWGWADAGTLISVSGSWGVSENANTNTEGRWEVFLETGVAGGPHQLKISTDVEDRLLEDILFGEVWLCGGQSNMEWTLGPKVGQGIDNWQAEVATANFPQIRFFDVPHSASVGVEKIGAGSWSACAPETATTFSAVGYLFGRRLHKELNVPIGLISCNWGGTVAETWMSPRGVASHGDFDGDLKRLGEMTTEDAWGLQALQDRWWKKLDQANAVMPKASEVVALPSTWSGDLNGFDGVVWYRRQVSIPKSWDGKPLTLELGPIDDNDTTWFGDLAVGKSHADGLWQTPRKYPVPAGHVRLGKVFIQVRAVDTGGAAGFTGKPEQMRLVLNENGESISLAGDWEWVKGTSLEKVGSFPRQNWPTQNVATVLYNGMLAPLVGYGIKGAIWYQGESNMGRAEQYRTLFPALIEDWRKLWRLGDFPFYFVQIAPFNYGRAEISSGALRDAQRTSLRVPNTGMAVTLDIGNPTNIHPTNKQDVADRLARWALTKNYGKDVGAISGPLFRSAELGQWKGKTAMRVEFDHADVLKTRNGKSPSHLELQTAKGKWIAAEGEIKDGVLWVYSEKVAAPTAVRFAWGDTDEPNLVNGDGLPASTFLSPPLSIPLFNGEDLTGWAPVNCDPSTWTAKDGMIVCSGKPTGLLRTTRMYENFELELEWRHLVPGGNAGLFVWSDPVPALGGPFARAVEVQVMDGPNASWYTTHGDIFPIWGATMKPMHRNPLGGSRCFPSEHRSKPSPEWNHYKVTCNNGSIRLEVNGKEVSGGDDISPRVGYIVLESEGTEAHFRNLKIRELPTAKLRPTRSEKALPATGMTPLYGGLNLDAWRTPADMAKHWKSKNWRIWTDGNGISLNTKISHPASLVSFHAKWKTMPKPDDSTSIQWGKQKINLTPSAANKWKTFFATYQSLEETLAPIEIHHKGGELEIANVLFRPVPSHSAVKPDPRQDEWWQKRHQAMNTAAQDSPADLLFIGDSITQAWEGPGARVWEEYYGNRNTLNLGISGDRTQHVLWRLQNGNLGATQPKLAVIMIGTNNSGANTGVEIADGIRKICDELRRQRPNLEILVLGIFPRGPDRNDPRRLVTEETNQLVESWASTQEKIQFLDIGEEFLTETGQLSKKIMPDLLHLNPSSYKVWAKAIETAVGKILPR